MEMEEPVLLSVIAPLVILNSNACRQVARASQPLLVPKSCHVADKVAKASPASDSGKLICVQMDGRSWSTR